LNIPVFQTGTHFERTAIIDYRAIGGYYALRAVNDVPMESGCSYPSPFDRLCLDQSTQRLARHAGLTQFGVNLTVIEPGCLVQPTSLAQQ
jgi:hypothetical protein